MSSRQQRGRMSLLVRNLQFQSSPDRVREVFERFGSVRDVYLPLDFHTKRPRGFGFVEYHDERDAAVALEELDQSEVDGNIIEVTLAQRGRSSPDSMRHREEKNGRDKDRSRNGDRGVGGGGGGGRDRREREGRVGDGGGSYSSLCQNGGRGRQNGSPSRSRSESRHRDRWVRNGYSGNPYSNNSHRRSPSYDYRRRHDHRRYDRSIGDYNGGRGADVYNRSVRDLQGDRSCMAVAGNDGRDGGGRGWTCEERGGSRTEGVGREERNGERFRSYCASPRTRSPNANYNHNITTDNNTSPPNSSSASSAPYDTAAVRQHYSRNNVVGDIREMRMGGSGDGMRGRSVEDLPNSSPQSSVTNCRAGNRPEKMADGAMRRASPHPQG